METLHYNDGTNAKELFQKLLNDFNDKQTALIAIMQKDAAELYDQLKQHVLSDVRKLTSNISKCMMQYNDVARGKDILIKFREDNYQLLY